MRDESGAVPIDERVVPAALAGPGEQLRAARLQQGLEIADVARQLKLFPRQIEALETDNFAALPSLVFVRGFIRNYARVLGLDAQPLLRMAGVTLEPAVAGPTPPVTAPKAEPVMAPTAPPGDDIVVPIPIAPAEPNRSWAWLIGAVVVVVVAGFGYGFLRQPSSNDTGAEVPVTLQPQPAVGSGQEAAGMAPPTTTDAANPANPAAAGAAPGIAPTPAETAAAMPGKAIPDVAADPSATGSGPAIHLSFSHAAWVEIRDRGGVVVFSQLSPAGAQRVVRGTPPFTLVVGNASGVAITYNGREVDLVPYTRTEVAHLTLE